MRKTLRRSPLQRRSPRGKGGEWGKRAPLPSGYEAFVELSAKGNKEDKEELNNKMIKELRNG